MKPDSKLTFTRRKRQLTSVLGLAIDGGKLEGVVLRRTNGSLQRLQSFSATLTLDPLTAAPELAGREIRNLLDAAGVRERNCIFAVPLKWVLTTHTELPPLPEADAASMLEIEAERGFSSDVASLQIGNSQAVLPADKKLVLFAGVPNTQINAIEQVLAAAKLKPASFGLGICALQPPVGETADGVLTLVVGEDGVGLQVTAGGGVVALRALAGTIENENGRRSLHTDIIARETRVTLGQLPAELRATIKHIRVYGPRELVQPLVDEMELRFEPAGMRVESVAAYKPDEYGVQLPPDTSVSIAFSLAARLLAGAKPVFEFLPPKPSAVELLVKKYTSGKLGTTGAVAATVAGIVILLFLYQQIELWYYNSQWSGMAAKVKDLQAVEALKLQYQPWYNTTFRNLSVMRQLSMVFPEDGSVTAKTIDIAGGDGTNVVSCSGTATDNASFLAMIGRLQASGVNNVSVDQTRGKAPLQFSFHYVYGGGNAN